MGTLMQLNYWLFPDLNDNTLFTTTHTNLCHHHYFYTFMCFFSCGQQSFIRRQFWSGHLIEFIIYALPSPNTDITSTPGVFLDPEPPWDFLSLFFFSCLLVPLALHIFDLPLLMSYMCPESGIVSTNTWSFTPMLLKLLIDLLGPIRLYIS